MSASEKDEDMEDLKPTVKSSSKNLLKSSDDDDSFSSEESELSELKALGTANGSAYAGKQEEISLDSDFQNIWRLQNQLQSLQKQLDREKSNKATVDNKRKSLENDNKTLNLKIETLNKDKRTLEQLKIELETKIRSLNLNLTEEHERRKNAEMMANRAKEQLTRNDEQCKAETAAKQKGEMTIRTLQIQLQNANSSLQQLEKEKSELQKKVLENQSSMIVAQSPGKEDLKSQLPLDDASVKSEASDSNEIIEKLNFELSVAKLNLEKERNEFKNTIESLMKENKQLQQSVNDMKNDLILDEDALAEKTLHYTVELGEMKNENSRLKSRIDDLEANKSELDNIRVTLSRTKSDLERTEKRNAELERSLNSETQLSKDKLKTRDEEAFRAKLESEAQAQKFMDLESTLGRSERELDNVNHELQGKMKELSALRNELERQQLSQEKLEDMNRQQKEDNIRQQVKLESLQDKVNRLQDEVSKLTKNLDDEKQKMKRSEEAALLMTGRKSDQEKAMQEIQLKNDSLNEKVEELRDRLELTDHLKGTLEKDLEATKEKLAEAQQTILSKKMALEVDDQLKNDLQSERDLLLKKLDRLSKELEDARILLSQADRKAADLTSQLQKTQMELSDSTKALKSKQEEMHLAMRQLEQNNAKLKDVVAEDELAKSQERKKVVTDSDKFGSESRRGRISNGNHSDGVLSSDETNFTGKHGRHQKKSDFDKEGRSRSRSETELRNTAMEKEVGKLKAQLRLAKKQLKAIESSGRYQPDVPQWQFGYGSSADLLQNHSDDLRLKLGTPGLGNQLAEIEARIRMDLNAKLAAINQYLQEHANTCEKIDVMREKSNKAIRSEFSTLEKELLEELNKLKQAQATATFKKDLKELDHEPLQLKDLYESNMQHAGQLRTNVHLKSTATSPIMINPEMNTELLSSSLNRGQIDLIRPWPLRMSLSGLPFTIKEQLDRSIAKHLEKAPQMKILNLPQDHSFTVAAMLDRSAHDYGSVLKRNYLIT